MTCPVATLVIVTLAPLITAAEGSVTFPTMLPVPTVVWAKLTRLDDISTATSATANQLSVRLLRGATICNLPFGRQGRNLLGMTRNLLFASKAGLF